jgi:hypothetical protein
VAGPTSIKLSGRRDGRRAGLYRLTATLADGGDARAVQVRIKRR